MNTQIKSNTENVNTELNKNSNFKIITGILIKFVSQILVKYRNFPNSISLIIFSLIIGGVNAADEERFSAYQSFNFNHNF